MALETEPGTNCLTRAEDRVAAAIGACEGWRRLVNAADTSLAIDTDEARADALARVHIDAIEEPANGTDYTLQEIQSRGTFAVVTANPEAGYQTTTGIAEGVRSTAAISVVAILEQFLPAAIAGEGINHTRRTKNRLVEIADQTHALLLDAYGYRYIDTVEVRGQPAFEYKQNAEQEILGARIQSSLVYTIGPGEGGGE